MAESANLRMRINFAINGIFQPSTNTDNRRRSRQNVFTTQMMPCGWEGNRRSGVALVMRHRLQWFIHLRAYGLRKADPTYTPHEVWHILPKRYTATLFRKSVPTLTLTTLSTLK